MQLGAANPVKSLFAGFPGKRGAGRRPVGPSNSEVIALGFFHAVDALRKKIGGHGATPVGEAVAKPKLDAVSIPNPFNLGTHAPSFKRIIAGGIGTGSFLKLSMAPIGCAILGRITQAPEGDGLGLHDCLGIGIGGTALMVGRGGGGFGGGVMPERVWRRLASGSTGKT